ncbi:tetratricopeptide repeat-containing sensor histidine kinase [Erythrobacter ani]|uniref:histidine kinase n=1 Tax=Erythrobacter ani TaxID=2827235 RepID=A0ABS6SKE1_9SPHN|nr:tetratricopeptide repeat protein [Erythrobacter ani]MBV7265456.1 tetratricopeptide repeat protein [Erythrobacter ani]
MTVKYGLLLLPAFVLTASTTALSGPVGQAHGAMALHDDSPCYPSLSDLDRAQESATQGEPNRAEKCMKALSTSPVDQRGYHLAAAMQGLLEISRLPHEKLSQLSFRKKDEAKVRALKLTGRSGDTSEAFEAEIIAARDVAISQGDLLAEAYALNFLGRISVRQDNLGELEEVIERLSQLESQLSAPRIKRDRLHYAGQLAKARGDTVDAIEFTRQLADYYGDHEGARVLSALSNITLGNIVYDLGDYEMALGFYEEGRQALEESGRTDTHNYAAILKNIGSSYTDMQKHEDALPYYERATAIDLKNGNSAGLGYNYFWHARSLDALGRRGEAIRMAREGAALSAEFGSPMEAANSYVWLAARELDEGQRDAALDSLLKGAELAGMKPGDDPREMLNGEHRYWAVSYARTMADVLERTGQRDEALRYANYALDMHSDWLEAEKVKASVNTQTLFELRNRDRNIELLEQQNALRASQLDSQRMGTISALGGALALAIIAGLLAHAWRTQQRVARLQQVLMREEHHRTRNALQLASSLTRSHERSGSNSMRDIRQRLQTMALLHDHLYTDDAEIRVDLCAFMRELADQLESAMAPEGVSIGVDCEKLSVPPSIATPLGLMICEMVINCCKYAFPDSSGTVTMRFARDELGLNISVCDDGVGNAESDAPPIPGTGTQLIHDLADQIGTSARFDQSADGSCWYLGPIPLRFSRVGGD